MARNNQVLVPDVQRALDSMKYEIASEIGLFVDGESWGHVTSRNAGRCGGQITKRLVEFAEQSLSGLQS